MSNMIIAFFQFIFNLFAKKVEINEVEVLNTIWKIERLSWDEGVWNFFVQNLDGGTYVGFDGPKDMEENLLIHAIASSIEEELRWIEMDQERRHELESHWDC